MLNMSNQRSTPMVTSQTPPNLPTEQGNLSAEKLGNLRQLAKESNRKTAMKSLYLMLKKEKVGTSRVESRAMKIVEEGQDERGERARMMKANGFPMKQRISCLRNEEVVLQLIDIKVAQCEKEEREVKERYRRVKKRIQKKATSESKTQLGKRDEKKQEKS